MNTSSIPPIGAPSWCLNQEALNQFNRSSINILVYDYDTDDIQNNSDNDTEDESINNEEISNRTNSNKRKKKKLKNKKEVKNINQNNPIFFFFEIFLCRCLLQSSLK
ncbi:unnamed protein product [Rhizophagus irregularis]|nr:unnamed protein product [Rhizophagus irregularis]